MRASWRTLGSRQVGPRRSRLRLRESPAKPGWTVSHARPQRREHVSNSIYSPAVKQLTRGSQLPAAD
jgi:hypothetical protein